MGPTHGCELKLSDQAPCDKILVFSHSIYRYTSPNTAFPWVIDVCAYDLCTLPEQLTDHSSLLGELFTVWDMPLGRPHQTMAPIEADIVQSHMTQILCEFTGYIG